LIRHRTILAALAPVALHALACEVDRGLGLVLRSELAPDGLWSEVFRAMAADASALAERVALWLLAGALLWVTLAWWRRRTDGGAWGEALEEETHALSPLYLRPAITLVALGSLALHPTYPYAFTLPIALTQDWGVGLDVAALAVLLALRVPAVRLPAPRAGEVFALCFLGYAVLVPDWAWLWEAHPGNEPKYLRQAVALGQGLTFDAEGVSAAMERLDTRPLAESIPATLATLGRESWGMAVALAHGDAGKDAIRATRITRQTVRGKRGGVYYVLAPGPSLLLAPALRLDRAINRARGVEGRIAVSVLLSVALAALLVAALFLLVRDATGRPGLAASLAFGFALVPPFLFYFFQFYPELPGALVLAVSLRTLALRPSGLRRHPWRFGWMLAALPWLHQKFLPVWLVLVATALVVSWREGERTPASTVWKASWARGLVVPTLVSLYLTALYNFAITGSVRPDALFLAWGPGGVTSARLGQGLLGLALDARYGILPYVPVFALAGAGLVVGGARRLAVVLPAAAVYYLTVASADNWAGAVSNLGRYVMPVLPLAVALVGIALDRITQPGPADGRIVPSPLESTTGQALEQGPLAAMRPTSRRPLRGALALALILAGWTGLVAAALRADPHAASDSALLLAKGTYADGNQYIPNLFIRSWASAAPGLGWRVAVWLGLLAALAIWWRRAARGRDGSGHSPLRTLTGVVGFLLAAGLLLERVAPPVWTAPHFRAAIAVAPETLAFLSGAAEVREDEATVGPGTVELLVRSPTGADRLRVTTGGHGVLRAGGLAPLVLRPTGALVDLPLHAYHEVRGRDGSKAVFTRAVLDVEGEAIVRPSRGEVHQQGPEQGASPTDGETEPAAPGAR
jgi:hypothetical protein